MKNIQRWRWLAVYVQTALVAGIPFIRMGGGSVLRFDIPTMRLHVLGQRLWMGEFHVVLIAALLFASLIIAFTLALGRVWCGWACPQTAIGEYVGKLKEHFRVRKSDTAPARALKRAGFHVSLAAFCSFVSANLIWYFVSPYEMLPELFSWSMGPVTRSFFVIMAAALFAHFELLGQRFCGTVCPYSKWQGVLLDRYSMVIAYDSSRAEECMGCGRCAAVCPTGIDIREGLQVECTSCAKCVDACRVMTAKRGRAPIVRYVFGEPGGRLKDALTGRFWLFAAVSAVLLVLLVYSIACREEVALQVTRAGQELYRVTGDGFVVNSYTANIANRSGDDGEYVLEIADLDGASLLTYGMPVRVPAGERAVLPFEVAVPGTKGGHGAARFRLVVRDSATGAEAEGEAGFIFP